MRRFRFVSYAAAALFVFILSPSCTYNDESVANKAINQRAFEEMWSKGNLEVISEIYAANYAGHGPAGTQGTNGLEAIKQSVTMYRTAFPDLQITVDDMTVEGNKVVTRWTARGTHKAELMGIAPTDKQITVMGISIVRIANGKIEESWNTWDRMDLMRQLGAAPEQQSPSGDPN